MFTRLMNFNRSTVVYWRELAAILGNLYKTCIGIERNKTTHQRLCFTKSFVFFPVRTLKTKELALVLRSPYLHVNRAKV
jgi:hypothetical protein